ncbi:SRPBCC domain-containing protein [Danxiaibacter flavus]|uniref:SRPBCC domain-containing protein n=1 Tax=Danxiaibacter flavus TaxID=3049108 RepID=A0ABV3ZPI7_9BACT|nr:SRPBCC domain-containing protein [Chitinophagaceae bacterium DXS]
MRDLNKMEVKKDLSNKKLVIERNFEATPEQVWMAWTQPEYLDQWWAPLPWRAETKSMDFKVGGRWLYCMVGPDETRHWCSVDFTRIEGQKSFENIDAFCDENGNRNYDMPAMKWKVDFAASATGTKVSIDVLFDSVADLEKIVEMGFQEGFASAMGNLDHYFSTHFKLRQDSKTGTPTRVCTYLNFNGKTEEAFNFYKKVFRGEFSGTGLQRFGDIEAPPDMPPLSEEDKKLIIHAELTILGGHILMATDAPESMGFKLKPGNNMHINLEPESREEAKRLFDELSEGGKVDMPMADMFWGAYFGSFSDKYGINWMVNYQEKNG